MSLAINKNRGQDSSPNLVDVDLCRRELAVNNLRTRNVSAIRSPTPKKKPEHTFIIISNSRSSITPSLFSSQRSTISSKWSTRRVSTVAQSPSA